MKLLIDRLADGDARIWARSGGVASWLIAQGYGPGAKSFATKSTDPSVLLGALRAGALISADGVPLPAGIAIEALAHLPVDAAVAERRLHITSDTPALRRGSAVVRHGDVKSLDDLL